jgi:hypothetical protein
LSKDIGKRFHTDSLIIEELGYLSASEGKYVTVKLDRWYYYINRAKLSLYEGAYRLEELKFVEEKCGRADTGSKDVPDCPKHFTLICRPSDLVALAKRILKLYTGNEDVQY